MRDGYRAGSFVLLPLAVSYLIERHCKNPYLQEREERLLGAVFDAPPSLTRSLTAVHAESL